ncbi:protease inhibitor I42 family protein [Silvanigrella aquatica]|uniref:Proteinase inhibitor I42 chagasin domain-containing protein n=1 Tax=Silvanigrella aquatica TaxID=1915309 RepID=A0A1L4CXC5_9BACT|nr:protease inhibitor I42 family protein [Silvanigrella aquatica]APJ02597.1 hypothetical protein AXG55_01065 [Silvanigrella aquatica]
MKKLTALATLCLSAPFLLAGCTSSSRTYELPKQADYQGYEIIDGVDKDTVSIEADKGDKIAVVIRDISTTAYSYIEPRYSNSMVTYEGSSKCCTPSSLLMGASGNAVYKFSFLGKGKTTIKIIARHKGESTTANSLDSDKVFTINVEVD